MYEKEFDGNMGLLNKLKEYMRIFGKKRNSTAVLFFSNGGINYLKVLDFFKVIRREPSINSLDLILDSGGGDIVMAVKITEICKHYSKNFTVLVPFLAKGAATIIALSADDLILGSVGELGPIDPQIKHPTLDMYFPASSIKNALEFLESSNDPDIRITMADKLDPLLIGAYIRSLDDSKQYLSELPIIKNSKNREEIIQAFTEKYIDHGYPITHEICDQLNLKFSLNLADDELEELLYDIHEEAKYLMELDNIETMILSPNNTHISIYDSNKFYKCKSIEGELEEDDI